MSEPIVINAQAAPAALPDALQGIARRYLGARQRANEATLEAASVLAEARHVAQHGEWYIFLETTNTSEDLADRLLAIHATAQQSPQFREVVDRGWLPDSTAALLARPSTPPEVRDKVVQLAATAGATGAAPPARRQVEQEIKATKPYPAPVRDTKSAPTAPAAPFVLTPMNSAPPTGAPTVLATVPAGSGLPPMLSLGAPASLPPPLAIGAPSSADPLAGFGGLAIPPVPTPLGLRGAEALAALAEQLHNLAEIERGRIRKELGATARVTIPDAAIEEAAKLLFLSSAVRAAALTLAKHATEE